MALQDLKDVEVRSLCMRVEDSEMTKVSGGDSLSATFLNYLSTAIKTIYNIGQSLGGSLRRIATGNVCRL